MRLHAGPGPDRALAPGRRPGHLARWWPKNKSPRASAENSPSWQQTMGSDQRQASHLSDLGQSLSALVLGDRGLQKDTPALSLQVHPWAPWPPISRLQGGELDVGRVRGAGVLGTAAGLLRLGVRRWGQGGVERPQQRTAPSPGCQCGQAGGSGPGSGKPRRLVQGRPGLSRPLPPATCTMPAAGCWSSGRGVRSVQRARPAQGPLGASVSPSVK